MTLDQYAPCPCGSGKKLKFCKCVDQPQEYEKIAKLIEGGQGVAAIDRINTLLNKTPNAAWLLAIKGELTLGMQEIESFKETAVRFLKLKPDNPLALIMRSMVSVLDEEPLDNCARYLLQGLSEAREGIPALTLSAIQILLSALTSTGQYSMVGYWSDLLVSLAGPEKGPPDDSPMLNPNINLLAKGLPKIIEDPADADWKERLAEVLSLAGSFRQTQAETKLRSILRDFPDQPGPLSHLLRAQITQLDQQGAYESARKLSDHVQVSVEDRAYFSALALELEPEQVAMETSRVVKYCEIDSVETVVEAVSKLEGVDRPAAEAEEELRRIYASVVNDEVPAKHIYLLYDKALGQEDSEEIASSVGSVVLFGKQTDKPARALFIAYDVAAYQSIIQRTLDALQLGAPLEAEIPTAIPYIEFLKRPKQLVAASNKVLTMEQRGRELVQDFLNMPLRHFDGKTPLEVVQDEKSRGWILGLLYHLEGEQGLVVSCEVINEIYAKLDIERPTVNIPSESETLRLTNVLDMDRIDIKALTDKQLKGMLFQSMSRGASRVFYHCATQVRERPAFESEVELRVAALSGLMPLLSGIEERIEICQELETLLAANNAPVGRIVIQHMSLLHAAGRPEEAQRVLQEGVTKYPNDPYLMSFVQYAMQAEGRMGPGGADPLAARMMQGGARPAASEPAADGGLVLPGQDSNNASDGESKLWLPGS